MPGTGAPGRTRKNPFGAREMSDEQKEPKGPKPHYLGLGLAVGVALGVALDNIAVGIAVGVAVGAALSMRVGR